MGKKRNVKKREKGEKNGLDHLIPFAFLLLFFAFSICFFFAFILLVFAFFWAFCLGKSKIKAKKSKSKKQKTSNKNANGQVHVFPIFPPFCLSFLFSCFFPFILLLCFLDFADLLFGFSILFVFFALFFKFLKNKNKLWFGEHNHNLNVSHSTRFLLVLSNSQVSPKFKESMFEFLSPTKYRFDA